MTCGRWNIAGAVAVLALTLGCGGEQGNDGTQPSGNTNSTSASAPADTRDPKQIVHAFLTAVKTGDDTTAESLLTKKALQETRARDLRVAPPGSETASFTIEGVEMIAEGTGAHVLSTWTEGVDDEKYTDEYLWVLRKDPEGWRIAGMITKPFEDLAPVALDFEDPDHMLAQQEMVEQEAMARARAAAGTQAPAQEGQGVNGQAAPQGQGVQPATATVPSDRPPLQR
jgi:hypothetical protein